MGVGNPRAAVGLQYMLTGLWRCVCCEWNIIVGGLVYMVVVSCSVEFGTTLGCSGIAQRPWRKGGPG